jgi:hypothetical protein
MLPLMPAADFAMSRRAETIRSANPEADDHEEK